MLKNMPFIAMLVGQGHTANKIVARPRQQQKKPTKPCVNASLGPICPQEMHSRGGW
ncbi:hypothetical protein DSUL_20480 [Desulfovibrionales bacterium]